jgi:type II secretory pathway component PulF
MRWSTRILLLEFWFFIALPALSVALARALGPPGAYIELLLFALWSWEVFTFCHYRHARQEEFLSVLQTAVATQAPLETTLRAYLADRPREHLYRGVLLFFVFPGYYFIHLQRSFDRRLNHLADMLGHGVPLERALSHAPGVVSRDTALAITVGQFGGKLPQALARLPDRRLAVQWLELVPRIIYPAFVLLNFTLIMLFIMIFIIPKFESIFLGFKMKLPWLTELIIHISRSSQQFAFAPLFWIVLLIAINILLFSSRARWHCPVVNWAYRAYTRGQFLRALGLMLESGKPLPDVLDRVLESGLLPGALVERVNRLASDVDEGVPLADSLAKHGLATGPTQGLIASAQKAQNLPWALQELGDSLVRRSARVSYRVVMTLFPLMIFSLAILVGLVAVGVFSPLVELLDGMGGR